MAANFDFGPARLFAVTWRYGHAMSASTLHKIAKEETCAIQIFGFDEWVYLIYYNYLPYFFTILRDA